MKRVFILSRHSLFCKGIEALLSEQAGLEIFNLGTDFDAASERIQELHPDVVLVDFDDPELDLGPTMICMLREQLGFCVIGLSLRDNWYSICRGEKKEILRVGDLLNVINT